MVVVNGNTRRRLMFSFEEKKKKRKEYGATSLVTYFMYWTNEA
jgi:hypothetical protein